MFNFLKSLNKQTKLLQFTNSDLIFCSVLVLTDLWQFIIRSGLMLVLSLWRSGLCGLWGSDQVWRWRMWRRGDGSQQHLEEGTRLWTGNNRRNGGSGETLQDGESPGSCAGSDGSWSALVLIQDDVLTCFYFVFRCWRPKWKQMRRSRALMTFWWRLTEPNRESTRATRSWEVSSDRSETSSHVGLSLPV